MLMVSKGTLMATIIIRGETSDGEPLEQTFQMPNGQVYEEWKATMYRYAVTALWEARWIPGSVSWQCFTIDGIALPVGENF
jgi:hypothetical protein